MFGCLGIEYWCQLSTGVIPLADSPQVHHDLNFPSNLSLDIGILLHSCAVEALERDDEGGGSLKAGKVDSSKVTYGRRSSGDPFTGAEQGVPTHLCPVAGRSRNRARTGNARVPACMHERVSEYLYL